MQTFDYLQIPFLYKGCVETIWVTISSDSSLGKQCSAEKSAVFHYQMVRKEERLVGWRFILQQDNDPKLQNKRTRQSASNDLETPLKSFRRNWTEE